jgi:hypothetical protein
MMVCASFLIARAVPAVGPHREGGHPKMSNARHKTAAADGRCPLRGVKPGAHNFSGQRAHLWYILEQTYLSTD